MPGVESRDIDASTGVIEHVKPQPLTQLFGGALSLQQTAATVAASVEIARTDWKINMTERGLLKSMGLLGYRGGHFCSFIFWEQWRLRLVLGYIFVPDKALLHKQ